MAKAHKTTASKSSSNNAATTKPNVISFRITDDQHLVLTQIQNRSPAVGVRSIKQLCRKVVCDYIAGRLAYKDPKHAKVDLEALG
jgi:hypothetical protein